MRIVRLAAPALIAVGMSALAASSALGAEEDFLYNPGTVNVIEIILPKAEEEKLEVEPFEYVKGAEVVVKKSEDGTPAGIVATPVGVFKNVEVKLKGKLAGSFEDLGGKAAFKLKFGKKEPFFGLRKVTLNNMAQDPSMIHESLAYSTFRAAGVPASRSGYAYVYLNNRNYGLHLNLESLDKVSLPKIFAVAGFDSETQHLFEADEYGADLYPGKEPLFEIDEGTEDFTALTSLISAVDAGGPEPLTTRLAPLVDFAEMTRMWGVERYIGHWDGYAGAGIPWETEFNEHRPNNYYLYTEPDGRFQMLPWGTDQTWGNVQNSSERLPFDGQDGRLFDQCREDPTCSGMFYAGVANALSTAQVLGLDARASSLAAMLAPWQEMEEAGPRRPYDADEIAAGVKATREFIATRPTEAEAWLAANAPSGPPVPASPVPPGEGADGIPKARPMGVEKIAGGFRLKFRAAVPGDAVLRGRTGFSGRQRQVCREERRVARRGGFSLVCRLTGKALDRLGRHAVAVDVVTEFDPDSGTPVLYTRRVTLPRS